MRLVTSVRRIDDRKRVEGCIKYEIRILLSIPQTLIVKVEINRHPSVESAVWQADDGRSTATAEAHSPASRRHLTGRRVGITRGSSA